MEGDQKRARQTVARGLSAWDRDDFDSALEAFEGVLEDFPEFADVQNKAGLCQAMLGHVDEALEHFDAAIDQNPSYAEAHLNRGIVLNELRRHEEAHSAFVRAIEIDNRDSRAFPSEVGNRIAVTHAQLGDLYLVANHPKEALRQYSAALAIRPRFSDIRTKFAETLIELGDFEQARDELKLILESRPFFVGARVRLGVVLHRLGDDEAAVQEWEQCLSQDRTDMRPRAYLASLGAQPPASGEGKGES